MCMSPRPDVPSSAAQAPTPSNRHAAFLVRRVNGLAPQPIWERVANPESGEPMWIRNPDREEQVAMRHANPAARASLPVAGAGAGSAGSRQPPVPTTKSGAFNTAWVRRITPAGSLVWEHVLRRQPSEVSDVGLAASFQFKPKCDWFSAEMNKLRIPWESGHVKLTIRRSHILEDAIEEFKKLSTEDLRKIIRVQFADEPALDAGGVAREFFELLVARLFDVSFGLFAYSHVDNLSYQIHVNSALLHSDHLDLYTFTGRVLGVAMFNGYPVNAHFTPPMYKTMLGLEVAVRDIEFVDKALWSSMEWMAGNDITDVIYETFAVTNTVLGEKKEVELKPGGKEIDVTEKNKFEYLVLLAKWKLVHSRSEQMGALLKGFYEVIPASTICAFDYRELELYMCGLPSIDLEDWKANTEYQGDFTASHKVVRWFWEVIAELSPELRAKLLQFSTGTSRVPVGGFPALQSYDGKMQKFTLRSLPRQEPPFPRAHTCFNRLELPLYRDKQELNNYISLVLQMEVTGFGLE